MKPELTKNCLICKKTFQKDGRVSMKIWNTQTKYCSRECVAKTKIGNKNRLGISYPAWNKGIPQTEEVKEKLSRKLKAVAKEKGFGKWMEGKKHTAQTKEKMSKSAKAVIARGEHNFYIDGRTPTRHSIRRSSAYQTWRTEVFERDNYTCQECGARNGNGKKVILNADHIEAFSLIIEKHAIDSVQAALMCADLWNIANGRTLCVPCHRKTPNYGSKALKT